MKRLVYAAGLTLAIPLGLQSLQASSIPAV